VLSLFSFPSGSKRFAAPPMYASGCAIVGTFKYTRDWRKWWLAPNAPIAPGETLITAPGLPSHELFP